MIPTYIYVQIAKIEIDEKIKEAAINNQIKVRCTSRKPIFTRAIKLLKLRAPRTSA